MGAQRIIDANYDDPTPAEMEAEDVENQIKAEFGESDDEVTWNIKVYRITGSLRQGNKEPYLFSCSPEELPIDDRLLQGYGNGKYRCRVFKNNRYHRAFEVSVEAPSKVYQAPAVQSEMATVLAALEQSNQRSLQFMQAMLDKQAASPAVQPDPFSMMERVMGMMANMRAAMPQESNAGNGIEMMMKGVELAQSISGSGETSFMDILKEFAKSPLIENAIGGIIANKAGASVPPQNGQRLQIPPVSPPNAQAMDTAQVNKLISSQIDFLIGKANSGADPSLYAEFVLDNIPPQMLEHLMNHPNIMGELMQINPRIGNHVQWFQNLLQNMRELYEEMSDEAAGTADGDNPNIGGTKGDVANPSGNAGNN